MLNIGKLAPGGDDYYLRTVASGMEDYYTGAGEAPGYWLGTGASQLALAGDVAPEIMRAVLGARDPRTGASLTGSKSRRSVPGFDCTFRAPKSVSLLYGLSDADTAATVRDAHDDAVAAAVGYLEGHAGFSRRGHGGAERVRVGGFIAAGFRHRTSRAGDPLLHTHVLVANVGRAVDDERWRTLDGRSLYVHAKTAGYLYQAQLRIELMRRLGVEWAPVRNGSADLSGVPEEVIRAFSQRRADIEAHMQRRGESSAKAAQTATLATRRTKQRHVEATALGAEWLNRAAALGFGPDEVAALTGRDVSCQLDPATLLSVAEELAGPTGLTGNASTFTRRDVARAWCDRLPAGADVDKILALADAVLDQDVGAAVPLENARAAVRSLAGDQVIRRSDGRIVAINADEVRYSTPELLALERRVIAAGIGREDAGVAVARPPVVEAALRRRPSMAGEQALMVRRLTTSGTGVDVVVGKAGAGKTFALDAAREAWQASGIRVIGCALAARAAAELHAGAGIDSYTIDALLIDLDRPGPGGGLASGSVLIVDEAGMVGTRKLARLLNHAERAQAKVVLVGDHHQLPEIDAGGVFRGLVHRLPVIELSENRRQRHWWEGHALDQLRSGDPSAAVAAYQAAGRLVLGDTAEAVREQLVSDWWAAHYANHGSHEAGVMIAARVADVEDLNDRARARLQAAGELTGRTLITADGRGFQVGDRIVCLRNDRRLGVINGTRATVTTVDPDAGIVTVRPDRREQVVELPRAYLDAGHVAHGYAITGHKAQGLTTEQTWVLGSDAIYREWGYVAMSRGRDSNHLYVVATDDATEELHAQTAEATTDAISELGQALRRSRAQRLAMDYAGHLPESAASSRRTTGRGRVRFRARVGATIPSGVAARRDRLHQQHTIAVEKAERIRQRLQSAQQVADDCMGLRRLLHHDRLRELNGQITRLAADLEVWESRIIELDADLDRIERDGRHADQEVTHTTTGDMECCEPLWRLRHDKEDAALASPEHVRHRLAPLSAPSNNHPVPRQAVADTVIEIGLH